MGNNIVEQRQLQDVNPLAQNGKNGNSIIEPSNQFNYNIAECELAIPFDSNQRNAYIVFGRDRISKLNTGFGGEGHLKASAMDIVVGRVSSFDAVTENKNLINPSAAADASRIYLSQKSNIDDHFAISAGRTGLSKARAAIAIKSDDIRIIARNTIKIVTEKDPKLSSNDGNFLLTGVQLIANNDSSNLQPIPKGEQLIRFILELQTSIEELNGQVAALTEIQSKIVKDLSDHTHTTIFWGKETNSSIPLKLSMKDAILQMNLKVEQGLKNQINNLTSVVNKYISGGPDYINSRFHFLN